MISYYEELILFLLEFVVASLLVERFKTFSSIKDELGRRYGFVRRDELEPLSTMLGRVRKDIRLIAVSLNQLVGTEFDLLRNTRRAARSGHFW